MKRVVATALLTGGLVAGSLAGAAGASAHATRIATDPADTAELTQAPTTVSATFNEAMQPQFAAMTVVGPDGNLWSILDMLVDSGIDCLDPIDPQAGMDLSAVKERIAGRIAIKGNVDCAHLMTFGTPDETAEATRLALRAGMPGGGYICSSSNSIHSGVKPENYLALMHTVRAEGVY